MSNANYDALITTTIEKRLTDLVDNVFKARPLFDIMQRNGNVKTYDGGHKIVVPIMHADASDRFQTYSDYDTFTLGTVAGISAAEYTWKQAGLSIAISGMEMAKNNGPQAIIDLVDAKVTQAKETFAEQLSNQLFTSDGTGNSGKNWLGLPALVGNNSVGPATVGGISASSHAYWRSVIQTGADEALSLAKLSSIYNQASRGSDVPNVQVTTAALWEKFEGLLTPNARFEDAKLAEGGFRSLMFRGSPVVWDPTCPAKYWYMLNTKYLWLVKHADRWLTMGPWIQPENADAKYALVTAYGNFVTSARKYQANVRNFT